MPSSRKREKPSSLGRLLIGLTKAMNRQAEAIDRLAASNEELVDLLMIERDGQEGDDPDLANVGMDGKPLQ